MLLRTPQLMLALAQASPSARARRQLSMSAATLIDFTGRRAAADWAAVDDRIMGGSSISSVAYADGCTCFEGQLIVDGGGFASVRHTQPFLLDREVEALSLEACGDGRRGYKLTLTTAAAPRGVTHQILLPLPPADGAAAAGDDGFSTLQLRLSAFKPSCRGSPAPDAPPLRAEDVRGVGLMLSRYEVAGGGPKASIPAGSFRLRLRRLAAIRPET